MLLDIHPEPEWPDLEVHRNGQVSVVGQLDTSSNAAKVLVARVLRSSVVEEGRFALERTREFEFLYHFSSVDDWLSYMADRWDDAVINPSLVTRARDLLREAPGEVIIRERVHAARLRRADPGAAPSSRP